MHIVRFVHAADLHLDAAFSGLAGQSPELAESLRRATFTALERLEALCLAERPDFLVIAGDLYNAEDGSLAAQLAVRDMCARLGEAGIPVFIAHGNHDPLSSRMKTLKWADSVTVFGEEAEARPLLRDGEPIAVIHGISHKSGREAESLARHFARADTLELPDGTQADCSRLPQIGLLHCTLDDSPDRYAPTTIAELEAARLDCWALGHVHQPRELGSRGQIAYSGSTQGLHINESGPHGCWLTTVGESGCSRVFHTLGPVEWRQIHIEIEHLDSAQNLQDIHDATLQRILEDPTKAGPETGPDLSVLRLHFTGRGSADSLLRGAKAREELLLNLRESAQAGQCWVKDLRVNTRPVVDIDLLREQRDDLLGECLRLAAQLRADPAALAESCAEALEDLGKSPKLRPYLEEFTAEELAALLDEAELACVDLLDTGLIGGAMTEAE